VSRKITGGAGACKAVDSPAPAAEFKGLPAGILLRDKMKREALCVDESMRIVVKTDLKSSANLVTARLRRIVKGTIKERCQTA